MKNPQSPILSKVLAAIDSGRVAMRPRWQLVLRSTLAWLGCLFTLLLLIYLASFLAFFLSGLHGLSVSAFGLQGLLALLRSLPWILIVLGLAMVFVLELLVSRYSFAYRRPLLFSVLGILLFVLLGALAINRAHLHDRLASRAQKRRLPVAGQFYRRFGPRRARTVASGTVFSIAARSLQIRDEGGEEITVWFSPQTRLRSRAPLQIGDFVLVAGRREGNSIAAFGIRKIEPRTRY